MHKIIALWAIPRSTSTAFEWMMRQRNDLDCLHEPFGEAWYQGEDPLWPRFMAGEKTTPGLTIESVWEDIQARAAKGPVFLKDFPHYINHMWTPEFLAYWFETAAATLCRVGKYAGAGTAGVSTHAATLCAFVSASSSGGIRD